MTKKIIAEPLAEVIAEYAEDVHLTYSGRGMYGETCYGFSGDVARIMGLGIILYFPGWSIASDCEIAKLRDCEIKNS